MTDAAIPVSVVVPTHGRRGLLQRTIDAIAGQDFAGPIECIVVHDDATAELPAHTAADGGRVTIRHLRNERTPGLAGSRNTGILAARHPRVAFCDDDDTWDPRKLRLQSDMMNRSPSQLVVGAANHVVYNGQRTPRTWPRDYVEFADLLRSRVAVLHVSTVLTTREAILSQIGLVSEEIPGGGCEDYEWTLRAARASRIGIVPMPLADILWHERSLFARRWDLFVGGLQFILDRVPEFDRCPRGKARICGQIAFGYAAMGDYATARRWARDCLRLDPRQARGYLALLVSTRLVPADVVVHRLHLHGRGI